MTAMKLCMKALLGIMEIGSRCIEWRLLVGRFLPTRSSPSQNRVVRVYDLLSNID